MSHKPGCCHEWADLYTDRNSPQSFRSGRYRGRKVVGRRCLRCHETFSNALGDADWLALIRRQPIIWGHIEEKDLQKTP